MFETSKIKILIIKILNNTEFKNNKYFIYLFFRVVFERRKEIFFFHPRLFDNIYIYNRKEVVNRHIPADAT